MTSPAPIRNHTIYVVTMAHNYEVGTRAWQPDATEGWVASEVKEKLVDGDKVKLVFVLENGEVRRNPHHGAPKCV